MKKLIFLIFITIFNTVDAQNPYKTINGQEVIDSLKRELSLASNDSLRAILSLKLTREYLLNRDQENFKKFYYQAKKYSKNNAFLNDLIFFRYSGFYMLESNYDAYIKHLELADKRLSKYNIEEVYKIRTHILLNKSIYYNDKNKTKSLNILLNEVLPLAKKINDYEVIVNSYKSIAIKFYNEKNYVKAEKFIYDAIKLFKSKKLDNKELLTEILLLQSEILVSLKKFDLAFHAIEEAKGIIKNHPNSDFQSIFYYSSGFYLHQQGFYFEAISNFNYGIKECEFNGDYLMRNRLNLMKVLSLKELGKYSEAEGILSKLLQDKSINVEDKVDYLKEMAMIYKKLNKLPEALNAYDEYITLHDSIQKSQFEERSAYLEKEIIEVENKENLNQLLYEKQKANQLAANQRLKIIITILIISLLVVFLMIIWLNFEKTKKLNYEKEMTLNHKITALKNEKEIIALYAMMEGEENERKRIARDLHDGFVNNLSSIKMRISKIYEEIKSDELKNIYQLLENNVIELRQVAYNLIPETLLKLGLDQALNDLCFNFYSKKTAISYHSSNLSNQIIKTHQITIYRIVQELVSNAIKHANASKITVDCSLNQNLFLITIEDNGIGFDVNQLQNIKGIGLKSIKNRVELLEGRMDLISNPNEGTCINIELYINCNDE